MPESRSFSIGVDRLLQDIRPYGRAESCYPRNLDDAQSRRKDNETLREWFVRIVDQFCGGDPKLVALEDNLAVFVRLGWKDRKQLLYANIQTVRATCDLDDYYLTAGAEAIYLRLDSDYKTLGDPFSHPLSHIHLEGDLAPRFALDGGNCGNIVVDYLEFLYRNYVPVKWLQWVQREWAEEFAGSAAEGAVDPLPTIIHAFTSSQFHVLRGYATQLERIKKMLRNRKDKLFDLHMDGSDRVILEYPLAR
jgi:hypothetical protein